MKCVEISHGNYEKFKEIMLSSQVLYAKIKDKFFKLNQYRDFDRTYKIILENIENCDDLHCWYSDDLYGDLCSGYAILFKE